MAPLVACVLLLMLAVAPRDALASANANWGTGVEATPPANAGAAPEVSLGDVQCPSAGDCTAVGSYVDNSGDRQGLLLTEAAGTWGAGAEAALPAGAASNPKVELVSVSCPSAGNCTAVGHYLNSSGNQQMLLLSESSGTWATGLKAALPANAAPEQEQEVVLNHLSCLSAGNCTAVGRYVDSSSFQQGLLLNETSGSWTTGVEAVLPANAASNPEVFMNGLSCSSVGNCTAVGDYTAGGDSPQGFLLTETSGAWGTGVEATAPANAGSRLFLDGVSCPAAGNCTAVGDYFDRSGDNQGLLLSETSGTWGTGIEAALPANTNTHPYVFLNGVSCPSPGNCTAVGVYIDSSEEGEGLLLSESSGTWGTGVEAPVPANAASDPLVRLGSASCPSAGSCSVASEYTERSGYRQGLLLTESAGTWAALEAALPANAGLNPKVSLGPVSCTSPDNCTAVGDYIDSSGHEQGLILTAIPATPALSVSAPPDGIVGGAVSASSVAGMLAGGAAASGTITFTVFGPQSTPPGSCASGGATVGTAGIAGNGTYHPSGLFTPTTPGDYWWYASYGGDPSNEPTASSCDAAMAETVVAPKATPALSVSAPAGGIVGGAVSASSVAGMLAGGAAASGTITFTVFGPQSTPPGSCASGGATVGTAGIAGNGTYHPSGLFTPTTPGDYWWYASYGGDPSNEPTASSCDAAMAETVVAASAKPPAPKLSGIKLITRKGVTLKLTVSQSATIEVLIAETVKGHMLRRVCKLSAKTGRRCVTTVKRRTLRFSGLPGSNTFKLDLARLGKGKYTATVIAENANGKSDAVKLLFTIARK